jgi:hypothetical protein
MLQTNRLRHNSHGQCQKANEKRKCWRVKTTFRFFGKIFPRFRGLNPPDVMCWLTHSPCKTYTVTTCSVTHCNANSSKYVLTTYRISGILCAWTKNQHSQCWNTRLITCLDSERGIIRQTIHAFRSPWILCTKRTKQSGQWVKFLHGRAQHVPSNESRNNQGARP